MEYKGDPDTTGLKLAIVISRFNEEVTLPIAEKAKQACHDFKVSKYDLVWVPGAFEIPFMTKQLLDTGHYNAAVCLGAVIRGETSHFDYICAHVAQQIGKLGLAYDYPILFGVLTTDTTEQAKHRIHKSGYETVAAAVLMHSLLLNIRK